MIIQCLSSISTKLLLVNFTHRSHSFFFYMILYWNPDGDWILLNIMTWNKLSKNEEGINVTHSVAQPLAFLLQFRLLKNLFDTENLIFWGSLLIALKGSITLPMAEIHKCCYENYQKESLKMIPTFFVRFKYVTLCWL